MKKYYIAAGCILSLVGSSCSNSKAESSAAKPLDSGVLVQTETVRRAEFTEVIRLTGTIESVHDVVVPAEESGRIVEWFVEKGQAVRKGQVLAAVDDGLIRAAYDAAVAQVNMADVNYEKQKQAYREQAVSELQLKNLEYQLDAARAQADIARQRLEKTKIVAPIDGWINDRFVDAGEMIAAGMPAAHVIDMNALKISVGVPERYAADLRPGAPADFTCDAYPDEPFAGIIRFVAPAVNPDNRTIPVEIRFTNAGLKLKPHMIARVELRLRTSRTIVIPEDYVRQIEAGRSVVYIARDHRAVERTVVLGRVHGRNVQVLDGLQEGDTLITVGFQDLVDQQLIRIQNAP